MKKFVFIFGQQFVESRSISQKNSTVWWSHIQKIISSFGKIKRILYFGNEKLGSPIYAIPNLKYINNFRNTQSLIFFTSESNDVGREFLVTKSRLTDIWARNVLRKCLILYCHVRFVYCSFKIGQVLRFSASSIKQTLIPSVYEFNTALILLACNRV